MLLQGNQSPRRCPPPDRNVPRFWRLTREALLPPNDAWPWEGDGRKPKTAPKNRLGYRSLMYPYEKSPFRCFLKWWYPQIIHLNRVFHYKPSILGYHHFRKHPCKPQNFVGIYVWNNPQESHPRTSHRYHVYTARGTPNCPLILKPLQMALYICFYGVLG